MSSTGAPDGNAVKPRLVRIFEPKRSKKAALDIRILGEEKYKFENVKDQQAGRMAEWDSMLEELQEMVRLFVFLGSMKNWLASESSSHY